MTTLNRVLSVLACVLLALGCSDEKKQECNRVLEGGHATEGAWIEMLDGAEDAIVGDPNASVITSPTEGQVLPAAEPAPLFAWTSSIATLPRPPRGAPILESIGSLFEGTAWAHEHPVTGAVYHLKITIPGRDCELEVITTETQWQVDDESWSAMKAASGELTLQITSAYMQETRITEAPHRPAQPRSFRVGP